MTEFYAYYELTCEIRDRAGGTTPEDAVSRIPDAISLMRRVAFAGSDAATTLNSAVVTLVRLAPHFEAEEHAPHAFDGDVQERRRRELQGNPSPPDRVNGLQFLWTVTMHLVTQFAFVLEAPTRAIAAERAESARLAVIAAMPRCLPRLDHASMTATTHSVDLWTPRHMIGSA